MPVIEWALRDKDSISSVFGLMDVVIGFISLLILKLNL